MEIIWIPSAAMLVYVPRGTNERGRDHHCRWCVPGHDLLAGKRQREGFERGLAAAAAARASPIRCWPEARDKPMTKPRHRSEDCLHCDLWPVINKFCADHPNGVVEGRAHGARRRDRRPARIGGLGALPGRVHRQDQRPDQAAHRHVRAQTDMWVGVSEDLIQGIDDGELQDAGMCIMEIGERGQLTRQQARRMERNGASSCSAIQTGCSGSRSTATATIHASCGRSRKSSRYVRQWARFAGMDDLEAAVRLLGPQSPVGRAMPNANNLGLLGRAELFGDG